MKSKFKIIFVGFILALVLWACGKSDEWKADSFVFVEYESSYYQRDISGVFCPPPPYFSVSVCYRFDQDSREIYNACAGVQVGKYTQLLLGYTNVLFDKYGGGFDELREIPALLNPVQVLGLEENGSVSLGFSDSVFELGINDDFYLKDTQIYVDTLAAGDDFDGLSTGDTLCVQEIGKTYRIKNWGFIEKGHFKKISEEDLFD